MSAPVLTPVTTSKTGSAVAPVTVSQPWRKPAPNAPLAPPPEMIRMSRTKGAPVSRWALYSRSTRRSAVFSIRLRSAATVFTYSTRMASSCSGLMSRFSRSWTFECFFAAFSCFLFFLASTDPGLNASIRTKQRNTDNQEHPSLLNDMMTTSRVFSDEIRAARIA